MNWRAIKFGAIAMAAAGVAKLQGHWTASVFGSPVLILMLVESFALFVWGCNNLATMYSANGTNLDGSKVKLAYMPACLLLVAQWGLYLAGLLEGWGE